MAQLTNARLTFINGTTPAIGAISGGAQTIPLKQINDLRTPELDIQKTVTTADGTCPGVETLTVNTGDKVKYCYIVSNPGNATLYNVNVIDDAGTPSNNADDFIVILSSGLEDLDGDGNKDDLAAGSTATGTALVTLSIVGTVVNNATATGDDSIIKPTTLTDSDIATVIAEGVPSYTIDKKVVSIDKDGDGIINNMGEVIEYNIIVNNTGSIDLTNVTLVDTLIPAADITGPAGDNSPLNVLNVGESWIFTGNYTVTQADINSNGGGDGFINNTATVDCTELDQLSDSEAVPITRTAAYIIDKTVKDVAGNGPEANVTKAGDVISYQIEVTNTGNFDLTNVTVNDSLIENLNGPVESLNAEGILEVGETWTYTGSYIITQADINTNGNGNGFINNTAMVDCDQLEPKSDSEKVPITQKPAYIIDKIITDIDGEGASSSVDKAGDVISYLIMVNNSGNMDLTNITVTDSLIENLKGPIGDDIEPGVLNVGETWTYIGTYTVTQADINSNGGGDGFIDNTATVGCDQLEPQEDSAKAPIKKNASYTIDKKVVDVAGKGSLGSVGKIGDVIAYQIIVTNDGNVDLTNVTVNDSLIENLNGPVESLNAEGILEVGETWTYTGEYTVTKEDIETDGGYDGYVDNTAMVDCDQLEPKSDSARVPIKAIPAIEPCPAYKIEKCVTDVDCRGPNAGVEEAGDVITYSIVVVNTGNVDLTNVIVTDTLIKNIKGPVESKNADGILNVGEKWTYTGKYTVTQEDMDTDGRCDGYIDNTATVDCDQLGPKCDSVRVPIKKAPIEVPAEEPIEEKQDYCIYKSIIGVDQAGDCIINKPGDIIEYQILVKNEGNTNLTGVSVSDPMITLAGPIGDEVDKRVLNPGESWKFFGNYTVTQADINSNGNGDGFIENTAVVSCNELPAENSSVKQPIVLASTDSNNSEDENSSDKDNNSNNDNKNGSTNNSNDASSSRNIKSNGGTGSAHVVSRSTANTDIKGNAAEKTGNEITLEPEIKNFEQITGNTEGNAEKVPEQKKSAGMPGFIIFGILGLLAILLYIAYKRK